MNNWIKLWFCQSLLVYLIQEVSGIVCFECSRIPYPRDCQYVTVCQDDEACVTRQVVTSTGIVFYYTGCQSKVRCMQRRAELDSNPLIPVYNIEDVSNDIETCIECCHGDFCNSQGCHSQPLPAIPARGPMCFSCSLSASPDTCDTVTICDIEQYCYLGVLTYGTGDRLFEAKCESKQTCEQRLSLLPIVGKRADLPCSGCCSTDYCNRNCSALDHSSPTDIDHTPTKPTQTTSQPLTVITSATITQSFEDQYCGQRGYRYLNALHRCVKLYTRLNVTFEAASLRCFQDGGHLIKFHNHVELDIIQQYLLQEIQSPVFMAVWTGASDLLTEGSWLWSDGSHVDKSLFHPGQPDNAYSGENCGVLNDWAANVRINDAPCDNLGQPLCELSVPGDTPTNFNTPDEYLCRSLGYVYLEGVDMCVKVYSHQESNWQDASRKCNEDGGHLVNLKTLNIDMFVTSLIKTDPDTKLNTVWVGASDLLTEGGWQWTDGSSVNVSALFSPGEPNNVYNEDCALMTVSDMHLNDYPCFTLLHFVCELDLPGLHQLTQGSDHPCRNTNYREIPGRKICYRIVNDRTANFLHAREICKRDGGDLLILRDREMEGYFQNLHFNDNQVMHRYLVGATSPSDDSNKASFHWLDGTNLDPALEWHSEEPNNFENRETCLAMSYFSGTNTATGFALNDVDCAHNYYFICEEKCSHPGYMFVPALNICFKIHGDKKTWDEASRVCSNEGGQLAELLHDQDISYMKMFLDNYRTAFDSVWLGAKSNPGDGQYRWTHAGGLALSQAVSGSDPQCLTIATSQQTHKHQLAGSACTVHRQYICSR